MTIVIVATVSFLFGAMLTSAWWMLRERPALDLMSARINVVAEDIREYAAQIGAPQ